jgi:hypothetical protein
MSADMKKPTIQTVDELVLQNFTIYGTRFGYFSHHIVKYNGFCRIYAEMLKYKVGRDDE